MGFIKKIILDGFKSYGRRVELTGFDDQFNAITGFNGSGKSNILDAIVFVLGLSKMETARCHSLTELIYKNGHAGVTVASVTLELDNSDDKFALTEYRNSRTIVVRREVNLKNQSKYYIEGFSVTKEKLLEFFHTVSLNIQNPHFLIMQGKIIKVSAAKPKEILSMVEEAVGVSIYENKKKQCRPKIEKCNKMLEDIETLIEFSIKPKVQQLIQEQKKLDDFNNLKAQIDKKNKLFVAHQYLNDSRIVNNADSAIEELNAKVAEKREENEQLDNDGKAIKGEIETLQNRLNEELGGNLKELEDKLNEKRGTFERISTDKRIKEENIKEETGKMDKLKKTVEKESKSTAQRKRDCESAESRMEALREENETSKASLDKAEKDYQAISLGLSRGRDGEEAATLAQQVMTSQDELSALEASENKSKLVIAHNQKEVSAKRHNVETERNSYERAQREIEKETAEVAVLERELADIQFDEQRFMQLDTELKEYQKERYSLADKRNQLQGQVPMAKFNPGRDFDRDDVLGVACDLFTLKSPDHALAIEKAVGGRMWNIVVKDNNVAKALLRPGVLKERRTLLPMNQLNGRATDMDTFRLAERLAGKGNIFWAINLVKFDAYYEPVMRIIFSDTLVCADIDLANKVAKATKKRVVTFDGEVFDPQGTLSGGWIDRTRQPLLTLAELNSLKAEIEELSIRITNHDEEYNRLKLHSRDFYAKRKSYELKQRHITLLQQNLVESNHHQLLADIQAMEAAIVEETANIVACTEKKADLVKRIAELQNKITNADAIQKKERKEADEMLKRARKLFEDSTKKLEKEQAAFDQLSLEIGHNEKTLADLREQLTKMETEIDQLNGQLVHLVAEIETAQRDIDEAKEAHDEYKKRLTEQSNEIRSRQKRLNGLTKKMEENEMAIKKLGHEIENVNDGIKAAKKNLETILRKNDWIREEEASFTDPESEYKALQTGEFDAEKCARELNQLRMDKNSMAKSVNMKASTMHAEKQRELKDLEEKRTITVKDAKTLERYMKRVEDEKDIALRKAWENINVSFSQIFNTFLDYAHCKLSMAKANDIRSGLEIKVQFGSEWKESLSELSGGQRSLVALSLVLALLKYNPAPLYILDEVDAALDQSHTQNIGIMIKKHFKDSQFIIVSLKDDMFNNANVLFQTKFIDGFSTVSRRCLQK